MNIQYFHTQNEWIEISVKTIQEKLNRCLQKEQITSLSVSGGSTPYPIYEALIQKNIQWENVQLIEVDERYVPENSNESNWKNIQTSFKGVNFYKTIYFEYKNTIQASVENVEKQLPNQLGVTILGMGQDGHFASLFPNGEYWRTPPIHKALITQAPDTYITRERLSLSPTYISNSQYIIVLLKGKDKYDFFMKLLSHRYSPETFPIQYILHHPNIEIYCYLD